jgi:DNA-directed RNA polymerase subunit RPC12/RpoP
VLDWLKMYGMDQETTNLLCNHCNKTFEAFLHDLAEKNAKVVCPSCGQTHTPNDASKPVARARPPKKTQP